VRSDLKKERLPNNCSHHFRIVRLCDEERRFGLLAREKQFSMPSNKDNRRIEGPKQRVDGVNAATAVGKLDIGKN
jgi:hypothetical protein